MNERRGAYDCMTGNNETIFNFEIFRKEENQ
jgi:hypothetical protein